MCYGRATMETDEAIQARRTLKVIADASSPWPPGDGIDQALDEMIRLAGMAPFHKPADKSYREDLVALVPWRFHVLDSRNCRALLANLNGRGIDGGKISGMLAAADALVQVTWLPNPPKDPEPGSALFSPTLENMEHSAAASAAVQNLLLATASRGIPNDWSSGGILREPTQFDLLGIPRHEILLGSIFLFPTDTRDADLHEGKLRAMREPVSDWARRVEID